MLLSKIAHRHSPGLVRRLGRISVHSQFVRVLPSEDVALSFNSSRPLDRPVAFSLQTRMMTTRLPGEEGSSPVDANRNSYSKFLTKVEVQKILRVDILSDEEKKVREALFMLEGPEYVDYLDVAEAGGLFLIPVVMRKWRDAPAIQHEGCLVLGSIFAHKRDWEELFLNAHSVAKESGALDAVVWAMKNYADYAAYPDGYNSLQMDGLWALGAMIVQTESKDNAIHLVNELKAIELIIGLLPKNPAEALDVLLQLAKWDELREEIINAGACRALCDIMDAHPNHQHNARNVLHMLTKE